MNLKLSPAIKFCHHIERIKFAFFVNSLPTEKDSEHELVSLKHKCSKSSTLLYRWSWNSPGALGPAGVSFLSLHFQGRRTHTEKAKTAQKWLSCQWKCSFWTFLPSHVPSLLPQSIYHNLCSIKDRNGMDLTEAEDIKRWQEYAEELYKKIFTIQIITMVWSLT